MLGVSKHVPKEHLVEARVHTEQTRNAVRLWIENSSGDYLALYIIGHKQVAAFVPAIVRPIHFIAVYNRLGWVSVNLSHFPKKST